MEGATPGVPMPVLVLAPARMDYLVPHTGCSKRGWDHAVRACRIVPPAGSGPRPALNATFLTQPGHNVLDQTTDDVDDTWENWMKVVQMGCVPAMRPCRWSRGSGFRGARSATSGSLLHRAGVRFPLRGSEVLRLLEGIGGEWRGGECM